MQKSNANILCVPSYKSLKQEFFILPILFPPFISMFFILLLGLITTALSSSPFGDLLLSCCVACQTLLIQIMMFLTLFQTKIAILFWWGGHQSENFLYSRIIWRIKVGPAWWRKQLHAKNSRPLNQMLVNWRIYWQSESFLLS